MNINIGKNYIKNDYFDVNIFISSMPRDTPRIRLSTLSALSYFTSFNTSLMTRATSTSSVQALWLSFILF